MQLPSQDRWPFRKMDGAGNDFVVFDLRALGEQTAQALRAIENHLQDIADRNNRHTQGCDQIVVICVSDSSDADVRMHVYNADGSKVDACGNATRCVAWVLFGEGKTAAKVIAGERVLAANQAASMDVRVDMGMPVFEPKLIPLSESISDSSSVSVNEAGLPPAFCLSMGNPHAVFFVEDATAYSAELGARIEHRTDIFPQRVNVSFAQVISGTEMKLRVWERGAGYTQACGTGACAAAVAAMRTGRMGRDVQVRMPGGTLRIEWDGENHVWMTGPVRDTTPANATLELT